MPTSTLHRSALATGLVAATTLLAGCGGGAGAADAGAGDGSGVNIVGLDTMPFAPETITVKAGEPARIVFRSGGILLHDFITEGADRNVRLAVVAGGRTAAGTFHAAKPGTYAVVCIQPGHRESGMVGKIVVE